MMNNKNMQVAPEQVLYAEILFWGCWSGIFIMIITYFIYLSGLLEPYIPIKTIQQSWHLPSHEFLKRLNIHPGWSWLSLLGKGDFINFLGITLLGGLTIIGYISLIFAYLKKLDKIYATITVLEILVLLLAASGILGVGGH